LLLYEKQVLVFTNNDLLNIMSSAVLFSCRWTNFTNKISYENFLWKKCFCHSYDSRIFLFYQR